jgi:hypothetical protein
MRVTILVSLLALGLALPLRGHAIGEATAFEFRGLTMRGLGDEPRATARKRISWAIRTRTSVETNLDPARVSLMDATLFEQPFLYLTGRGAFPPPSDAEIERLARFLRFGGFLLVDDPGLDDGGFDASVRAMLARALPAERLAPIDAGHVLYRSFYLIDRPVGRVRGPDVLEGIDLRGRIAVAYSRHDLGGAWARDNLGTYEHAVVPGGEDQREMAYRLGVNIVAYVLCLDYKDDQVHAPFIMRRRGGSR